MQGGMGRPSGGPMGGMGSMGEMGGKGMGGMMGAMSGRGRGPGMGAGMGGIPGAADAAKLVKLTRTDFLIQFIWQPPTADKPVKPIDEIRKDLIAAQSDEKNKGAIAAADFSKVEQQLDQESEKRSMDLIKAQDASAAKAANSATPTPPGPGGAVTPAAPATPAVPATPGVSPTVPNASAPR